MNKIEIIIPEFITHVAYTNNKTAPNKYKKINSQFLYNGSIHRFTRAIVMNNLHDYIESHLTSFKGLNIDFPVKITYEVHTVLNHGSISMRKGLICWKKVKKGYVPNYDLDNLLNIWSKAGNDALTRSGVIADDNVSIIKEIAYKFVEVEDINDRALVITIEKIE